MIEEKRLGSFWPLMMPVEYIHAIKKVKMSIHAQSVFVFLLYLNHLNSDVHEDVTSYDEIAEWCNMSQATSKKALKELKKLGWIDYEIRLLCTGDEERFFFEIFGCPPGIPKRKEMIRENENLIYKKVIPV